jgi:hypothetical protein
MAGFQIPAIYTDQPHDHLAEQWVAHILVSIPVGEPGIAFGGGLADGIVVNHRRQGVSTVSFRPSPAGVNTRQYTSPFAAARAIMTRTHNEEGG